MTVFSAPDYPQFIHEASERYNNKAAVAVLSAPDWATPEMRVFEAVHPRPQASPFYDVCAVVDSDEEYEPAPSNASGLTDVQREHAESSQGDEASSSRQGLSAADGQDAVATAQPQPSSDGALAEGEGALAAAAPAAPAEPPAAATLVDAACSKEGLPGPLALAASDSGDKENKGGRGGWVGGRGKAGGCSA